MLSYCDINSLYLVWRYITSILEKNSIIILIFVSTLLFIRFIFPEETSFHQKILREKMAEEYLRKHQIEDDEFFNN